VHLAVFGPRAREQILRRVPHRRSVGESEAHEPALRLVGDASPA